jgi:hypothetical protein
VLKNYQIKVFLRDLIAVVVTAAAIELKRFKRTDENQHSAYICILQVIIQHKKSIVTLNKTSNFKEIKTTTVTKIKQRCF